VLHFRKNEGKKLRKVDSAVMLKNSKNKKPKFFVSINSGINVARRLLWSNNPLLL